MRKFFYIFVLSLFFSAYGEEKNDVDFYVNKLKEHRSFTENEMISPSYEDDYFLCPSSYIYQEMHTALTQFAKNPEGVFISPWQNYAQVQWEDGDEKPEYNVIKTAEIKKDGSQGRNLGDVKYEPKPKDIEEIANILPDDIDYKTNIYIDGDTIVIEEDFSAYYEKEDETKTIGKNFRNLMALFPENCEITILNKSRRNWKLDTQNHKINLRRLQKNRAEIEFYLPIAKQKEIENQGYEIIALDKKGRRLKLVYDDKIPAVIAHSFNKAGTDIWPKARQNLVQKEPSQLWEKGEYHLIKAEGIIDNIYFKSFNGEAQATASVSIKDMDFKEASVMFLGENPYHGPVAYTLTDVKNHIDITEHEQYYEIDLPASLNSLYAYVAFKDDEIIYSQDRKILISKEKLENQKPRLYYPLQMSIRLFDQKGEDYILSEGETKLSFIPEELEISNKAEYYNKNETLAYPYRIYDKKGNMLKIISAEHRVDKCGYQEAKDALNKAKNDALTIRNIIEKTENELLEIETLIALHMTHEEYAHNLLTELKQNIKDKEEELKALTQKWENDQKEALTAFTEIENLQNAKDKIYAEVKTGNEADETASSLVIELINAKEKLPILQRKAIKSRKAYLKASEELELKQKNWEAKNKERESIKEKISLKQVEQKNKEESLTNTQMKLEKVEDNQKVIESQVEELQAKPKGVCKVEILANEKIDWLETAMPEAYEEIQLEQF